MNHRSSQRDWASEWAAYRSLSDVPVHEPAAPAPPSPSEVDLQVGSGSFSPAASLLRQLQAAINPDDFERTLTADMHLVSSGAMEKVRLRAGDVRHLNPDLKSTWSREVHVLLLKVDETRERVLAVPFGPLSTPAFESELATGLRDASLAVLCLWNAAWISMDHASRSWLVEEADETLLGDAGDLRSALAGRRPVPARLAERTGTPLLHPADPRHAYADGEEGLLEDLEGLL